MFERCPVCRTDVVYRILPPQAANTVEDTLTVFTLRDRIEVPPQRAKTGIDGLDRVLNGGVVMRGTYLLAGPPGSGKTSLALKIAANIANAGNLTLYVSGEQEEGELQAMAKRLGARSELLYLACTQNVEEVLDAIGQLRPTKVVFDSINAARTEATPGDMAQIKASASKLVAAAKDNEAGFSLILVGHVTKDDTEIAGPRSLEHLVDAVLMYTLAANGRRFLRVEKHRHGPSGEFAAFDMTGSGLLEVPIVSTQMLERLREPSVGYVVYPSVGGARPLLVEVEAFVADPHDAVGAATERRFFGMGSERMSSLLGTIREDAKVDLAGRSVFVEVTSMLGSEVREVGLDFAVAAVIISSALDLKLPAGLVACGQFGVTGKARSVERVVERSKAALDAGCALMFLPLGHEHEVVAGVEAVGISSVAHLRSELESLAKRVATAIDGNAE